MAKKKKLSNTLLDLQRRARAKERRLVKSLINQGMDEDMANLQVYSSAFAGPSPTASPVVDINKVKDMTPGQKNAYIAKLKKFVSRKHQLVVIGQQNYADNLQMEDGSWVQTLDDMASVVTMKDYKKARGNVKERNADLKAGKKVLDSTVQELKKMGIKPKYMEEEFYGKRPYETDFKGYHGVGDFKKALNATKSDKAITKQAYKDVRKWWIGAAKDRGREDLVKKLKKLTDEEIDVIYRATDIAESAGFIYDVEGMNPRVVSKYEDDFEEALNRGLEIAKKVQAERRKKTRARLNRNRRRKK